MINKFLYPNGGSESYVFQLGDYLQKQGHRVQYFGMEHKGRCVGNRVEAYTSDMDFHGKAVLSRLTYAVKTIYSREARALIRKVLDDFRPDVCHLNNFNYQLTPSVILEITKWKQDTGRPCRMIYTAHDYQLVCPNHMLFNPIHKEICEKCAGGHFVNCVKGRCIHGSVIKSIVGSAESYYWNRRRTYGYIDAVICPSEFVKTKLDRNPFLCGKTRVLHNFIGYSDCGHEKTREKDKEKKRYALYFGRLSEEKGITTLIRAAKSLPEVHFVFAGTGPFSRQTTHISNIKYVGFKSGEELKALIRNATFTMLPSQWYEVFGLTIGESIVNGTPVIGARIGAVPELISDMRNGLLYEAGDERSLEQAILMIWRNPEIESRLREGCRDHIFQDVESYTEELLKIYGQKQVEYRNCRRTG